MIFPSNVRQNLKQNLMQLGAVLALFLILEAEIFPEPGCQDKNAS